MKKRKANNPWMPAIEGHYKCRACGWDDELTWRQFLAMLKTACPRCGNTVEQSGGVK